MRTPLEPEFGVVELRRYQLHAERRDALIALYDAEFIESQEACGMKPIGHYRDLDDPQGFVWFRGFDHIENRRPALEGFYNRSRAWIEHRHAANATMIDSDNVLLLRPARANSGFDLRGLERPGPGSAQLAPSVVAVAVLMLAQPAGDAFLEAFEAEMLPAASARALRVAYFVSETRPNDFPALPVREKEFAFVVSGILDDAAAAARWTSQFEPGELPQTLRAQLVGFEPLRLAPAPRSLLR